jgi:hypothetical protein
MGRITWLSLGLLVASAAGCSFSRSSSGEGPGTDGGFVPDVNLPSDHTLISTDVPVANADAFCDAITATPNPLPPDILILLDRSLSMADDINDKTCAGGCGANSKWSLMTAAINQAVGASETKIKWGLKFFGNDNGTTCGVTAGAAVAPGLMNAAAIATAIGNTAPATSTPTTAAEESAGQYLGTLTDQNPKFVLLATDGQPTCGTSGGAGGGADDANAIASVMSVATLGFQTFVVGIATTGMGMADMTLNAMATAGGRPQAGTSKYYPVANGADLVAAIEAIQAMAALTCTYDLGGRPSSPDQVGVFIDGQPATQGTDWMFGPNDSTVVLTGATCQAVMAGSVQSVQIYLPCGIIIIP